MGFLWDAILNPFITILTLLYSVFGNNVVLAIVVATVLTRIVTWPLLAQQQRSSKAMQELQPKLKKLQEKYKNDREKLSQEQMALYKEHGVNPVGGCLPLVIQFPILIAFYQAIIYTLAATPLQLIGMSGRLLIPDLEALIPLENMWLHMDLTQPPTANPMYALALPAIVVATSWLQSKMMMPTSQPATNEDGTPNQAAAMTQSMTTIMPLMLGFFSLSFSVGLSIYFVVSNIMGIAQYSFMGKGDLRRVFGGGKDEKDGDDKLKDTTDKSSKPEIVDSKTVNGSGKESRTKSKSKSRTKAKASGAK